MRHPGLVSLVAVALLPTAQFARALHVAERHWHGLPACGQPAVVVEPLTPGVLGEAEFGSCRIMLQAAEAGWQEWPQLLCEVVVHEWGHLVLGPTYFEASNPAEPEHSADPRNIMYRTLPDRFAPCERHDLGVAAAVRRTTQPPAQRWKATCAATTLAPGGCHRDHE